MLKLWLGLVLASSALLLVPSASASKDPNLLRAEAFVDRQCPAQERSIATDLWVAGSAFNALYGNCRAGDGRDQHVWFFSGARFIGSDTREPDSSKEIIGLWRDGNTIAFMYVLYRRADSNCCATGGGKIIRFRIEGSHVKALDPATAASAWINPARPVVGSRVRRASVRQCSGMSPEERSRLDPRGVLNWRSRFWTGLQRVGLFGALAAGAGTSIVSVAAPRGDWTIVIVGATLVIAGGATVLLNRRYKS